MPFVNTADLAHNLYNGTMNSDANRTNYDQRASKDDELYTPTVADESPYAGRHKQKDFKMMVECAEPGVFGQTKTTSTSPNYREKLCASSSVPPVFHWGGQRTAPSLPCVA